AGLDDREPGDRADQVREVGGLPRGDVALVEDGGRGGGLLTVLAVERGGDDDGVAEAGDGALGSGREPAPEGSQNQHRDDLAHRALLSKANASSPLLGTKMRGGGEVEREHESARNPSPAPRGRRCGRAAGLLASGSSYSRAFPRGRPMSGSTPVQWHVRFRTRLQWRGPRRYLTGFPLQDTRTSPCEEALASPHRLVCQRSPPRRGAGRKESTAAAGGRRRELRPTERPRLPRPRFS